MKTIYDGTKCLLIQSLGWVVPICPANGLQKSKEGRELTIIGTVQGKSLETPIQYASTY